MNVFFRVDASDQMGTGHVMRCLSLAEALHASGNKIHFICRAHRGNLICLIQEKNFPVLELPTEAAEDVAKGEDYAAWLGATQNEDAQQTIEVLNGEMPSWLAVDHYGLDIKWQHQLRPFVKNILVIDDLANRNHDCDVLLDQNYSNMGAERYATRVPDSCKLLLGPSYALLQPEYALFQNKVKQHAGNVKNILVFMGGSDPHNITKMAVEALVNSALDYLEVDIIIGANNDNLNSLKEQYSNKLQIEFFSHRKHLADLMSQSDLAIGGVGGATWERMCMGLPTLAISLADNQSPASEALAKAGLIAYAGHFTDLTTEKLSKLLQELIKAPEILVEMSEKGKQFVDGLGASRVAKIMNA